MSALAIMLESGFNFSVKGKDLLVSPANKLSNEQRQFIKQHKPQIIAELKAEKNADGLSYQDKAAILRWLHSIGETDQAVFDDVLDYCAGNSEALAYYLKRAGEAMSEHMVDDRVEGIAVEHMVDDRRHCHECLNLRNGYCIKQRFRPVDDIPRRCEGFTNN